MKELLDQKIKEFEDRFAKTNEYRDYDQVYVECSAEELKDWIREQLIDMYVAGIDNGLNKLKVNNQS